MPRDPTAGLSVGDQWIERLLESTAAKAIVVLLIALSLLPMLDRPWLHGTLFLPVFGVEFVLRLRLFLARRSSIRRRSAAGEPVQARERRPLEPLLLLFDLVAVVSFIPLWHLFESGRLLRLARLARLAIVVRYAADLLHDLWVVVTRRERLGQLLLLLLTVATLSFVSAALLLYADPRDPLHGGDVVEAFWWSFRQLESPDNIVQTLYDAPAKVVASVLLTLTGIFLMAFLIGLGTNVVGALVVAARYRPLDLEGHLVLAAPPGAARRILRDLRRLEPRNVRERPAREGGFRSPARRVRRWLGRRRVVLVGTDPEPPTFLLDPDFRRVTYRPTALVDPRGAALVAADQARHVTLVSDDADPAGDARCLSSALAVGEALVRAAAEDAAQFGGPVPRDLFLELRATASLPAAKPIRDRLHDAGIGCAVLDTESLLGRFLAIHVIDPGLDPIYDHVLATAGQTIWVRLAGEDPGRWVRGPAPHLPAAPPLARSWRDYRVLPLGLLAARPDAETPRGSSPLRRTQDCTARLGLGPADERPPPDRVDGLVALAMTEHLVRDWVRALAAGRLDEPDPDPSPAAVRFAETLELAGYDLRRVLLVGDHPSLPALLAELIRFVPGVEVELLPETTPSIEDLAASLRDGLRGVAIDATIRRDGAESLRLALPDGREGAVSLHDDENRRGAATHGVDLVDLERFDRVVFLSHPAAPAADDGTTARVLRIADEAARLDRCRIVVQLESESRAELLAGAVRAHARPGCAPPVSVLAAEQVRAHLLAHAMLTPGIVPVLDELLAERGQEFVRLTPRPPQARDSDERVSFGDLLLALARRGPGPITAVGWALERDGRWSVAVNPEPGERPRLGEIRAVYAVADSALLRGNATASGERTGR